MTDQSLMKSKEANSKVDETVQDSDGEDYATILLHRLWKSEDEADPEEPHVQEYEGGQASTYSKEKESEEPAGTSADPEPSAVGGVKSNILSLHKEEPVQKDSIDSGGRALCPKVLSIIEDSSIYISRGASSSSEENSSVVTNSVQAKALPQQATAAIETPVAKTTVAENDVNSSDTRVNTGFMDSWNSVLSDVRTMLRIVWNRVRHLRPFLIKIIEIIQNWARRGISGAFIAGTIIRSAGHTARHFLYGVDWTSTATLQKFATALFCVWTLIFIVRRLIVQCMRAVLARLFRR